MNVPASGRSGLLVPGAVAVGIAVFVAWSTATAYSPKQGAIRRGMVTETTVDIDGSRASEPGDQVARIGVEECRDLESGDRVVFTFTFNPRFRGSSGGQGIVDYPGASFLIELEGNANVDGTCDRDEQDEPSACRELDPSTAGLDINSQRNRSLTVSIEFETLREYFDRREAEVCTFEGEDQTGTASSPLGHDAGVDAGLDAGAAAVDAGDSDTGGRDVGAEGADGGSSGDTGIPQGGGDGSFDRIYAVRAFVDGRTQGVVGVETREEIVDAALRLDRTRPPSPTDFSEALVSENALKVRFSPPSDSGDVEDYAVFLSRTELDAGQKPETLADRGDVTVRTLQEAEDSTVWKTSNLDREEGGAVYLGVAARDEAGNFSPIEPMEESKRVQKSPNFWERYKRSGGSQPGGCTIASRPGSPVRPRPSPWVVLVVAVGAGISPVRRRS